MIAGVVSAWLTAADAAAYLGLPSAAALRKRVERGQVPAHRWGRQLRFKRSELDGLVGPIRAPGKSGTNQEARGAARRMGAATLVPPSAAPDEVASAAVSAAAGGEIR